jgi:uncharacterized membrane protein
MAEMTTMTVPRTRQGVRDLDQIRGEVIPFSGEPAPGKNMGPLDRAACGVGGAALLLFGLSRGTLPGFALAALGGALVYRAASGYCPLYAELGISTAGNTDTGAEIVYRP